MLEMSLTINNSKLNELLDDIPTFENSLNSYFSVGINQLKYEEPKIFFGLSWWKKCDIVICKKYKDKITGDDNILFGFPKSLIARFPTLTALDIPVITADIIADYDNLDDLIESAEAWSQISQLKERMETEVRLLKALKERLIPSEQLADKCYEVGWKGEYFDKQEFLDGEIEI